MATASDVNLAVLERYLGRTVRTEDRTMFNCGMSKLHESKEHKDWHRSPVHGDDASCRPSDVFGGEGKVIEVRREEDGKVLLVFDWGYAMPILASTKIIDVTEARNGNG